jgi:hypothetical protein
MNTIKYKDSGSIILQSQQKSYSHLKLDLQLHHVKFVSILLYFFYLKEATPIYYE